MASRGYAPTAGLGPDQLGQMSQPTSPTISPFPASYSASTDSQYHDLGTQQYFHPSSFPYFSDGGTRYSSAHVPALDSGPSSQYTSSQNSAISTPEGSAHSFDEKPFSYESPSTSHFSQPYFVDEQPLYSEPSLKPQLATRTSYIQPTHFKHPQIPTSSTPVGRLEHFQGRRRSLSHGDADAIASTISTSSIQNPTFIRLQAPRAKPLRLEDKRRNRARPKHARSASYGPGGHPTSYSASARSSTNLLGLLPTSIGTPLSYDESTSTSSSLDDTITHEAQDNGPIFEHMTSQADLLRSKRIIQIGALMVQESQRQQGCIDPSLISPLAAAKQQPTLLEKFSDVERHLEMHGSTSEVLEACMTIRDALEAPASGRSESVQSEALVSVDMLDVPSRAVSSEYHDMMDEDMGESDLMAMLRNENLRRK